MAMIRYAADLFKRMRAYSAGKVSGQVLEMLDRANINALPQTAQGKAQNCG